MKGLRKDCWLLAGTALAVVLVAAGPLAGVHVWRRWDDARRGRAILAALASDEANEVARTLYFLLKEEDLPSPSIWRDRLHERVMELLSSPEPEIPRAAILASWRVGVLERPDGRERVQRAIETYNESEREKSRRNGGHQQFSLETYDGKYWIRVEQGMP